MVAAPRQTSVTMRLGNMVYRYDFTFIENEALKDLHRKAYEDLCFKPPEQYPLSLDKYLQLAFELGEQAKEYNERSQNQD